MLYKKYCIPSPTKIGTYQFGIVHDDMVLERTTDDFVPICWGNIINKRDSGRWIKNCVTSFMDGPLGTVWKCIATHNPYKPKEALWHSALWNRYGPCIFLSTLVLLLLLLCRLRHWKVKKSSHTQWLYWPTSNEWAFVRSCKGILSTYSCFYISPSVRKKNQVFSFFSDSLIISKVNKLIYK